MSLPHRLARPLAHVALATCLVVTVLVLVLLPPGRTSTTEAATRVAKGACRSIDPHLVDGACLGWSTGRGSGLTWIGTVVHPQGLEVGERARPPIGGLGGPIMGLVQEMWGQGSRFRVPYELLVGSRDRGELARRRNGTHRTRSTTVEVAGCYTYSERLPATASTAPASTRPGVPLETVLVTKPVRPYVPEVPSGPAAGDQHGLGSAALAGAEALDREATVPTSRAEPRYLHRTYRAP